MINVKETPDGACGLDPAEARLTGLRGLVRGFVIAFGWGAALLGVAAVIVLVLIRTGKEDIPTGAPTHLG